MRFRTTLLQSGKTAVGIQVPNEVVEGLGAGKRPPVRVTINGYTYRNTIGVMGGVFMVGVSAENREKARVAGGQDVDVEFELDTEQRARAACRFCDDPGPRVRREARVRQLVAQPTASIGAA